MQACLSAPTPSSILKQWVDYGNGSPEMQVNDHTEEPFIAYLIVRVIREGAVDLKDAVNAGALRVGCSTASTRRYLDRQASSEGLFEEYKEPMMRQKMIRFRKRYHEARSTDGPVLPTNGHRSAIGQRTDQQAPVTASAKRRERLRRHNGTGKHG